VDTLPAAAQPVDGANTQRLAISIPQPVHTLADAATIEFAPGLRRPPSLGTPPPPPKPGDPPQQDRLGQAIADSAGRRWRVLVPVVCVGLLVVTIGIGLAYLGGKSTTPTAAPRSLPEQIGTPAAAVEKPAATSATTEPTTSAPTRPTTSAVPPAAVDQMATTPPPPPPPTAALAGPATVPFGESFSFVASGFACAGVHLLVTLGGESIPAVPLDGAGNTNIAVNVSADG
jgi:hypothetical protein